MILLLGFFVAKSVFAASTASVRATIKVSVCGNGIAEQNEYCDGSDLNGRSCSSYGFSYGNISCRSDCNFDLSNCSNQSSGGNSGGSSGGSSGGNSGGSTSVSVRPVVTTVNFNGRAYPKSTITLLKDAQVVASSLANDNATFQMSLSGLAGGNYMFSLYSEDKQGNRSSLLTFPVSITSGTTTNISNIFIAPTISTDKTEVKQGDTVVIFGQTAPSSEVTILVNSDEDHFAKTKADSQGVYLYKFNTSVLEEGQHFTKSKSSLNEEITAYGKAVGFLVGSKSILSKKQPIQTKILGDVNGDGKVNIVDFSITAFWYKRSKPSTSADLNGDGKVNIVDFSLMAYSWTG